MKYPVFAALLLLSLHCSAQVEVNIDQLITETQLSNGDPDDMNLVWWIPIEFWKAVFESEPSMTQDQINETIEVLKPYSMFAIVLGKIGPFGGVTYTKVGEIKQNLVLIDRNQKEYKPIEFEELNSDTQILVSSFKPILEHMLGEMGENVHFFVFPDYDKTSTRISNPKIDGEVAIRALDIEYVWKTPLGSLLAPKKCPVDGKILNGAWMFCPWHGVKLLAKDE